MVKAVISVFQESATPDEYLLSDRPGLRREARSKEEVHAGTVLPHSS